MFLVCCRCKARHEDWFPGVEVDDAWMCQGCVKLMDGFYTHGIGRMNQEQLYAHVAKLEAENADLKRIILLTAEADSRGR